MGANLQRHRSHSSSEASQSQDLPEATVQVHSPQSQSQSSVKDPSETAMPDADVKKGDSIQSVCSSTALDDFLANDADLKVCVAGLYKVTNYVDSNLPHCGTGPTLLLGALLHACKYF